MKRIVVGITGASGVVYGVRMLEVLSQLGIEAHFIVNKAGATNLEIETNYTKNKLESMAFHAYDEADLSACLASCSWKVGGVVVAP